MIRMIVEQMMPAQVRALDIPTGAALRYDKGDKLMPLVTRRRLPLSGHATPALKWRTTARAIALSLGHACIRESLDDPG